MWRNRAIPARFWARSAGRCSTRILGLQHLLRHLRRWDIEEHPSPCSKQGEGCFSMCRAGIELQNRELSIAASQIFTQQRREHAAVTNLEREKQSVSGKRMSLLFILIFCALTVLI